MQFKQVVEVVPNVQNCWDEAVARAVCYDAVREDLYQLIVKVQEMFMTNDSNNKIMPSKSISTLKKMDDQDAKSLIGFD